MSATPITADRDLVAQTVSDLADSLEHLAKQRVAIAQTIEQTQQELATIDTKIAELNARKSTWEQKIKTSENISQKPRRKHGEAEGLITQTLIDLPRGSAGLTLSAIKDKTGISWSSVRNVLTRKTDLFETHGNLWKLKENKGQDHLEVPRMKLG